MKKSLYHDLFFKLEKKGVNISNSFVKRVCCKHCGKRPTYYFFSLKPYMFEDVQDNLDFSKYCKDHTKRMCYDWFLKNHPRLYKKASYFSFPANQGYCPAFHRTVGSLTEEMENVNEFLTCECGLTTWVFNEKSIRGRQEIKNRRGRYNYPQKFGY